MTLKPVPHYTKRLPIVSRLQRLFELIQFGNAPNHFMLHAILKRGDAVRFSILGRDAVIIADADMVQEMLIRKKHIFVKSELTRRVMSGLLGQGLLVSVGDYHSHQRKMIQPAFHATRIHAYAETMVDTAEAMIANWRDGANRDLHADMMQVTMEVVAKTLFGAGDVLDDVIAVGEAMVILQDSANRSLRSFVNLPYWANSKYYDRVIEAGETVDRVVMRFINDRRASGATETGDLLSMLLLSEDENGQRMTDKEVRDEAITLFSAGHETTSNALTWTFYLLGEHPEIAQKLYQELDAVLGGRRPTLDDLRNLPYTHQILKEAIRLYPPAWTLTGRTALEDTSLGEFAIPKGATVFAAPYVFHHHPKYWDEPEAFKPERFADESTFHRYQYFPFGAGEHICIGNSYAMMEAAFVLATIASRYEVAPISNQPAAERALITLMPKHGIQMRVTQRTPELVPV